MNGMTAKEAAEKWGITPRQVQLLCANRRIPGAVRFGHAWVIPSDAEKPEDRRSGVIRNAISSTNEEV